MDKPINQIIAIKSYEQLKSYLQERPNINLAIMLDKNGTNLLHFAAFNNDLNKMKLFILHYKQFTIMNHGTGMYTGEATFSGKLKAWANSQNNQGYIPIHYATLHGNLEMIKFLEQIGTNMHYKTTKQQNVLFMAAQYNQVKSLIYLIQSGHNYDVNARNCRQQTILHIAALKGFVQMISYLLTVGADIEAADSKNCTPLITATKHNKKQSVKILLIKGADRRAYDNQQKTSLAIAQQNGAEQLSKILNDNYGFWDKVKIKCNKKIVYGPQSPTYVYSLFFISLFHLFFLPVNLLTEFIIQQKYIKIVPFIFQGIYELIVLTFYILLFKKFKKRPPKDLMDVPSPFCAQCKRKLGSRSFHCYICGRCVYRYDHHCPWINNCVGSHNVGKFTFFLLLLSLGLMEVIFCSGSMLVFKGDKYVRYRQNFDLPDGLHFFLNIITIIFGLLLLFGILNIFFGQIRNIFTNSTSLERTRGNKKKVKKSTLSENDLNQSLQTDEEAVQDEQQVKQSCCTNMVQMLSGPS